MECCICMDVISFNNSYENIYATQCGHIFHVVCLNNWVTTSSVNGNTVSCPYCRVVIKQGSPIKLHLQKPLPRKMDEVDYKLKAMERDNAFRVTDLKATIQKTVSTLQKLDNEIPQIQNSKSLAEDTVKKAASICRKSLQAGVKDSMKTTEKKVATALSHIIEFEEKMFVANQKLTELLENMNVTGADDIQIHGRYEKPFYSY